MNSLPGILLSCLLTSICLPLAWPTTGKGGKPRPGGQMSRGAYQVALRPYVQVTLLHRAPMQIKKPERVGARQLGSGELVQLYLCCAVIG